MNSQANINNTAAAQVKASMKTVTADNLTATCNSLHVVKKKSVTFTSVAPAATSESGSLVFVNSEALLSSAIQNKASGLVVLQKYISMLPDLETLDCAIWSTENIQFCMHQTLQLFDSKTPINSEIHSTAYVDATAKIGQGTVLEPYSVVGKNVIIGENCVIGAHAVLENNVIIGASSKIAAHAYIGFNCQIGSFCNIGPHSSIGSDGFGYFTNKKGEHHKIPQIGQVIIEDYFECGAFCAIDRAALTETRIRKGAKLDNLIHIAHNCDIGENAMLTSGFMIAGSTIVGKNLTTAGGVHINGHIKIADNVILSGRAGVTSSIEKSGVYGGFPHMDHKQNLKVMIAHMQLPKLRKQISQIIKHLGLKDDET